MARIRPGVDPMGLDADAMVQAGGLGYRAVCAAAALSGSLLAAQQSWWASVSVMGVGGVVLAAIGIALKAHESYINRRVAARKQQVEAAVEVARIEQAARLQREAEEADARMRIEERTKDSLGRQMETLRAELRKLNEKGHEQANQMNLMALRHKEEIEQYEDHVKQLMGIIEGLREDIRRLSARQENAKQELVSGQADVKQAVRAEIASAAAATTGVIKEGLDKIAQSAAPVAPRGPSDESAPIGEDRR